MPTALELTSRVLQEVGDSADGGIVRDCAGELANVIAGQAKTLLFGTPYHFTFSLPSILTVNSTERNTGRWVIAFASDVGGFALHFHFPLN